MKATLNLRLFSGSLSLITTDQSKFMLRCSAETTLVHSSSPRIMRLLSLIGESPADGFPFLQPPDARVETQPDDSDQQHARHYQVITLAGVARVDDEVAQALI